MSKTYYLGWDVGAWHCDKNSNSRDAIEILMKESDDKETTKINKPYWGNLKNTILAATDTKHFIQEIFALCKVEQNVDFKNDHFILAIDAPLGFPKGVKKLLNSEMFSPFEESEKPASIENHLLYRLTEKYIYDNWEGNDGKKKKPLSLIQDSIGSQATKAMFLIKQLRMRLSENGVWKKDNLTIIETYPAINKMHFEDELKTLKFRNGDIEDAYICAKVTEEFDRKHNRLVKPEDFIKEEVENNNKEKVEDLNSIIKAEGWVWYLAKKKETNS